MPIPYAALATLFAAGMGAYGAHQQQQAANQANQQSSQAVMFDPTSPRLGNTPELMQGPARDVTAGINPFSQNINMLMPQGMGGMYDAVGRDRAGQSQEAMAQNQNASFLGGLQGGAPMGFGGLENAFAQMMQQQQGMGPIGAGMASAGQAQLGDLESMLFGMAGRGDMQNPFAQMGAFNQGQQVNAAAQPLFDRNLQSANAQLNNMAPGRFGTAFVQQGQDLSTKALQDFNLFQQQNLMQGLGLQNQQQQQALNFMLGARGLQQEGALGALGQVGGNRLGNAQLQTQASIANAGNATQANIANRQFGQQGMGQFLDAFLGLGDLQLRARDSWANQGLDASRQIFDQANIRATNEFDRAQGAHGSGLDQYNTITNPMLQILLGGMNQFGPSDLNTVTGVNTIFGPDGVQRYGVPASQPRR